jgi:D-alanyl-D-alanine carboxypeptidase
MQNQAFRQIVSTKYYSPRHWQNKNKMLERYEGAIGVKTGYTKEAGRCLVSAAERDGMTLICTLLNCPTTYERTCELFDDAFFAYRMVKLLSVGEEFSVDSQIGRVREEFAYPLLEGEKEAVEYHVQPAKVAHDKEIIGVLEITLAKRLLFSTNLYKL